MATIEIPLTQGKFAIIDAEDWPLVKGMSWCPQKARHTYYVISGKRKSQSRSHYKMHRVILGITDPKVLVDHRDGNGLNNTRANLRVATSLQNCLNQAKAKGLSRYKGVFPSNGKWESRIKANGSRHYLGRFVSEEDAAIAYDKAAREYFGEFAKLNFPVGG